MAIPQKVHPIYKIILLPHKAEKCVWLTC